eukprot:3010228-Prymnesium_polylepis.1
MSSLPTRVRDALTSARARGGGGVARPALARYASNSYCRCAVLESSAEATRETDGRAERRGGGARSERAE